jgi:2-polyprenyl-6-methoxyphenol hydroxylase-like FAD-dependent oxidoreductase
MSPSHAVVIGASMAGLMAARTLADHFDHVTVVERDRLPDGPEGRKSVPQGFHAHTLLIRGKQILEEFFPGLSADLVMHGAVESDSSADVIWHQHGVYKMRKPCGLIATSTSRPLLEWRVRAHLQRVKNVALVQGYRVTGLHATPDKTRVTGVGLEPVDGSGPATSLPADLVVDAGGRGTRAPQWLADLGYGAVPVTEIRTNVGYASRYFRFAGPVAPDYNMCLLMQAPPATRVGVLFRVEGNRWLLTLQTMLDDTVPSDEEGMLAFARTLPGPQIAKFLEQAVPDSEIQAHRTPTNLRRHYEQMARFPDGLVVLGDACTSFNPRYGQGMTTAALGAVALRDTLDATGDLTAPGFSRRYQKALAAAIALPWQASTGEDFAFPQVAGRRPPGAGLINWFMRRVIRLTAVDHAALVGFLKVVHLLQGPAGLMRPRLLWRVLFG